MKVTGIIAEYNPFHRGHEYQIKYIKETLKSDYVVAVMSGDYVQRGTPALLPKYVRAEMALRCGADLVLELPVSVSTASAEAFAGGGVSMLHELGIIDELCFGSESGKIGELKALAQILNEEPDEYRELLKKFTSEGMSFPAARSQALIGSFQDIRALRKTVSDGEFLSSADQISEVLHSPNNILGIEYCKALCRMNSRIRPVTLTRRGMEYHGKVLLDDPDKDLDHYASASAIREEIMKVQETQKYCRIIKQIPEKAAALFEQNLISGNYLSESSLDILLSYCILKENAGSLMEYMDVSRDLAERIINRRNEISGFSQAAILLKTKEITQSRVQRALLHVILGIKTVPKKIPYARVLGFNKDSSILMKEIKNKGSIPLITKLADADTILDAQGMALLNETTFASNLYEKMLSQKNGRPFVHEYQKKIIIL